jgi:hypothetical protein
VLVVYELQKLSKSDSRKTERESLAIRFRKTLTRILGRPRIPRAIRPITRGGRHLACLTGSHPHFLYEDDVDGLVCSSWPESINALSAIELDGQQQLVMISSEVSLFSGSSCIATLTRFVSVQAALLEVQPLAKDDTLRIRRKRLERTYTHLNYDARSSCYVGASAIAVPYQLYSDECELIPGPEGGFISCLVTLRC